jgi:hypothetical protein
MPRTAAASDFQVDVEGLGTFTFGRRTQQDVFRIRGDYTRVTGANFDGDGNASDMPALAYATITVLLVEAPSGFKLEADPLLEDDWEVRLLRVFHALREKELSFRPQLREGSEEKSA